MSARVESVFQAAWAAAEQQAAKAKADAAEIARLKLEVELRSQHISDISDIKALGQ